MKEKRYDEESWKAIKEIMTEEFAKSEEKWRKEQIITNRIAATALTTAIVGGIAVTAILIKRGQNDGRY